MFISTMLYSIDELWVGFNISPLADIEDSLLNIQENFISNDINELGFDEGLYLIRKVS